MDASTPDDDAVMNPPRRSLATWLALACALLIVYASLYPFEGWRWPPGQTADDLWWLPPALHQSSFDRWSNGLGYLPMGLLLALAALRSGLRARWALPLALVLSAALSYGCEWLQHLVPSRVPTREDFFLNTAGAAAGAALALALQRLGWVDRWSRLRQRWFSGDAAYAMALLLLWPVALLFPAPAPLGLGQGSEALRQGLLELLHGADWAAPLAQTLTPRAAAGLALSPLEEVAITALGLLGVSLVAFVVTARGAQRVGLAFGAALLAVAGMTLSTVLNFGPHNAWAWVGPRTLPALGLGLGLALLCAALPARLVAALALVVLTAALALVAQAPSDPYLAHSLQLWEQGRFVRFHGLAQWLGWLWPLLAIVWLLAWLTRAD